MKHVFVIHSSITDAMAQAVIDFLELSPSNCVFWCERGAVPSRWADRHHQFPKDSISSNEGDWGVVSDFVGRVCGGESFIFYPPHLGNYSWQRAVGMASCTGYYWLEEGMLAYNVVYDKWYPRRNNAVIFARHWLRSLSHARQRQSPVSAWDVRQKYRGVYCSSNMAFEGFPGRQVVDGVLKALPDSDRWRGSHIVALPPLTTPQQNKQFSLAAGSMGERLQHCSGQKYYRFHPDQVRHSETAAGWRRVLEDEWGLEQMNPRDQVDNIVHNTPCTVHLCDSSVGVYALTGVSKVLCYVRYPSAAMSALVFRRMSDPKSCNYEEVQ
jgi:hypothetical protein